MERGGSVQECRQWRLCSRLPLRPKLDLHSPITHNLTSKKLPKQKENSHHRWFVASYINGRWVQAECKKLGDSDNPEVSERLKMAVRCLKERPVLFKYCAEESSEASSRIFLINCLAAIQQPLMGHDVAAKLMENLGSMIKSHIGILVDGEVDAILRRCGLLNKISWITRSKDPEHGGEVKPLAEIDDMYPQLLSESLRSFFGIVTGTEGSLPEFEQMQVPKLRSDACLHVAREVAESYEPIYYAVVESKNRYPEARSLLKHTPYQIRTILAI